jgi:transposase
MGPDGMPEVKIRKGKNSGKPTKRYLSLRRFQKMLGVAPVREQSGEGRSKTKKAGSSLCRTALWQWLYTRIEPGNSNSALKNEMGKKLREIFELEKSHKPIKLARSRTVAKATQLLFSELVREVIGSNDED